MEDTIAAISTPIGEGAISIIRISGNKALDIIKKIFTKNIKKTRYAYYGHIIEDKKTIDDAIVIYYKAPYSYTGQDLIEINIHGSLYLQKKILNLIIQNGARLAEKGEFTKRAFLNSKLDLSQAEAVMDLISSKNEFLATNSLNILHGALKEKLNPIKENLKKLLAHIEALVDFPEDEVEQLNKIEYIEKLNKDKLLIKNLLEISDIGIKLKEGIKTVIAGYVNVGKSSLFNLLVNEDKAIVTNIAGTTRDILEEIIYLDEIPLHIYDTAGIREKGSLVEKIGIEKSFNTIQSAQLILFLIDASRKINQNEINLINQIYKNNKKIILIKNKIDKGNKKIQDVSIPKEIPIVEISVKEAKGIDNLKKEIRKILFKENKALISENNDIPLITKIRHKDILQKTYRLLDDIIQDLKNNQELDLTSIYIRDALNYIGKITGETVTEDILDEIFSNFCIGK